MEVREPIVPYIISSITSSASILADVKRFENAIEHLDFIKQRSKVPDDVIAYWLNVNVKTYRSYRNHKNELKPDQVEHIVILERLIAHGVSVFGPDGFPTWLLQENFMFDRQRPADLLNTNSGVRLVDDRITGIEFGDNA